MDPSSPLFGESVSVVMPAYNEADALPISVKKTADVLSSACRDYEIIVVDDHSTDATATVLRDLSASIPSLRFSANPGQPGKGSAVSYGATLATKDLVVLLDADLDLPPEQLPVFFSTYEKSGADIVIGSKLHPDSQLEVTPRRSWMSRGYRTIVSLLFAFPYRDTQTGLKLFRRTVLTELLPSVRTARFVYDLELLLLAHEKGHRIVEAPVIVHSTSQAGSSVNLRAVCQSLVETGGIWVRRMGRRFR